MTTSDPNYQMANTKVLALFLWALSVYMIKLDDGANAYFKKVVIAR